MEWSLFSSSLPLLFEFFLGGMCVLCFWRTSQSVGTISMHLYLPQSFTQAAEAFLFYCNAISQPLSLSFITTELPDYFLWILTHLPVPPLKFPNPAPVLRLFYVMIHNSSFKLSTIPPSWLSPWYVFWILCEMDRTNCICKIWINKPYHKP